MTEQYFEFLNRRRTYFVHKHSFDGAFGLNKKKFKVAELRAAFSHEKGELEEGGVVGGAFLPASRFTFSKHESTDPYRGYELFIDGMSVKYRHEEGQVDFKINHRDYGITLHLDACDHETIRELGDFLIQIANKEQQTYKHKKALVSGDSDTKTLQRTQRPKAHFLFQKPD